MSACSLVKEMDFSVVIFDTAPTGHTLRFLSMPNLFVKGMEKIGKFKGQFGSIFSQVCISALCLSHRAYNISSVTFIKYPLIEHSQCIVGLYYCSCCQWLVSQWGRSLHH